MRGPDSLGTQRLTTSGPLRAEINTIPHWRQPHRIGHGGNSYSTNMSLEHVRQLLPPAFLNEVQSLWFQHILNKEDMVVPCQRSMMKWFRKDEEFDKICSHTFRPSLDAIKQQNITAQDIIDSTHPSSPLEWISLIVLFDQIPRNIYRGTESIVVFTFFDPIAQQLAKAAIASGVHQHPSVKYRIGHRLWITMPFMHSESPEEHERAVRLIQEMTEDINEVDANDTPTSNDSVNDVDELWECKRIIAANKEAAIKLCESQIQFELKHRDIIDKFGRYPHRNGPLGRAMMKDEQDFLYSGGDTFGG
ncbi:hypothetical protein VP1G_03631 [Cytospora mali]|uniref:Uncharacterized protein n=1 Tax=Cytospora mali TaxID=578113 RepID=A0A194UX99_CYTMA|nr:hypothetical protein VP1G_03631 [Valsa mali var. pyri (nom. inval.)]